jgi:hypothetical protein
MSAQAIPYLVKALNVFSLSLDWTSPIGLALLAHI